jgi:hypothetical protein
MPRKTAVAVKPPAVQAVVRWLISGADEAEVLASLAAQYPGTDAKKMMAAVRDALVVEGTPDTDALRGWAIASYRDIYRRMLQDDDLVGAAKVLKNLTDLVGL